LDPHRHKHEQNLAPSLKEQNKERFTSKKEQWQAAHIGYAVPSFERKRSIRLIKNLCGY